MMIPEGPSRGRKIRIEGIQNGNARFRKKTGSYEIDVNRAVSTPLARLQPSTRFDTVYVQLVPYRASVMYMRFMLISTMLYLHPSTIFSTAL